MAPFFVKNPIKSNRYKITNKINTLYVIDFIGYFIRALQMYSPSI